MLIEAFISLFESENLSPKVEELGLSPLGDKFRKLIFDRVSQPAPLLQDEVFAQIQFIFCSQRGDYKEKWGWQNILH